MVLSSTLITALIPRAGTVRSRVDRIPSKCRLGLPTRTLRRGGWVGSGRPQTEKLQPLHVSYTELFRPPEEIFPFGGAKMAISLISEGAKLGNGSSQTPNVEYVIHHSDHHETTYLEPPIYG